MEQKRTQKMTQKRTYLGYSLATQLTLSFFFMCRDVSGHRKCKYRAKRYFCNCADVAVFADFSFPLLSVSLQELPFIT